MKRKSALLRGLLWLFLLCGEAAWAHLAGMTDTAIEVAQPGLRILFTTSADNLAELNAVGEASAVKANSAILAAFNVTEQGKPCSMRLLGQRPLPAIQSVQFELRADCADPHQVSIRYELFAGSESHENFVRLRIAGHHQTQTLSDRYRSIELPLDQLLAQWNVQLPADFSSDDLNASPESVTASLNSSYLSLGIEHILSGWDHLAFLLGLLLLPVGLKRVVWVATSFTLAHSVTLASSALNLVSVPASIVEWLIAFSIAAIAAENAYLYWKTADQAWPQRVASLNQLAGRRTAISFGFGLIHGFGFSYVLKEIGLGDNAAWSLALFNLGVEIGQLAVILLLWPALNWMFRQSFASKGALALTSFTGVLGVFWMVERMV